MSNAQVIQSQEDDPVLIEVDARLIRDLVALTAIALQIATGSATAGLVGFDIPIYQTANARLPVSSVEASA